MPRSIAARLAFLQELHGPAMYDDDGFYIGRDYENGLISDEQFRELLDMVDEPESET